MPVRRFWFMQGQIDRICAIESLDKIPLMQSSMGGEGVKDYVADLKERAGLIVDSRPAENIKTEESEKAKLRALSGKVR